MVSAELEPTVTGISPAEGPPGTIVKIRGENLGRSEKDLLGKVLIKNICIFVSSKLFMCRFFF